jgi:hypothetical protein
VEVPTALVNGYSLISVFDLGLLGSVNHLYPALCPRPKPSSGVLRWMDFSLAIIITHTLRFPWSTGLSPSWRSCPSSLLPSGPSCFIVGSQGGRYCVYYLFEFNDFAGSTRRSRISFLFILYIYYKIFPRLWQELFH